MKRFHAGQKVLLLVLAVGFTAVWSGPSAIASDGDSVTLSQEDHERSMRRHETGSLIDIGKPAPEFTAKMIDGGEVSLSDLRGKVVYVYFYTTWCGWCDRQRPYIADPIWKKYKDNPDFVMIAISHGEDVGKVRRDQKQTRVSFPIAADPSSVIYNSYFNEVVLRSVVIDRGGIVRFREGEHERAAMEKTFNDRGVSPYSARMTLRYDFLTAAIDKALAETSSAKPIYE